MNALEYAYKAGREYAAQVAEDFRNHQEGPGQYEPHQEIPDCDYCELVRLFPNHNAAEMEAEYRRGYNESV